MPMYEYECLTCKKVHEIMQKFSDHPLQECPDCKSPVNKLISLSSFSLKGSGWYATDYRRSNKKKEEPPICPTTNKPCGSAKAPCTKS
ncbi:MAG: zinc ribbon domain-containing protein [Deltaproteobacteria bacterium]|nr:zinc ribbon domain-containing protein [Deltaproteobacteria bacterium]